MTDVERTTLMLLRASLFTNENILINDTDAVFAEMKEQTVAALPSEWLKNHPIYSEWNKYCSLQQGQWIRIMYAQSQLINLLEENAILS